MRKGDTQGGPARGMARACLATALSLLGGLALALSPAAALAGGDPGGVTAPGSATADPGGAGTPTETPAPGAAHSGLTDAREKASQPRRTSTHRAAVTTHAIAHSVVIKKVRCVPAADCSTRQHEVSTRGRLLLQGTGLRSGMQVAFPLKPGARISSRSPTAHLHKTELGLVVDVPSKAHSGRISILLGPGHPLPSFGRITIVHHKLHPPVESSVAPTEVDAPAPSTPATPGGSPFQGDGMWIWYMSKSSGGNVSDIAAQAKAAGVSTLYIKSSDGPTNFWSQFTPELIEELHGYGLKVCAWQYVYGSSPIQEAELGARAVEDGADCLVIDAESQYEGHYAAAQRYIETLRAKIGARYPLGLASFPYVNYHPAFPYSVFLGPGGAQFNVPQMYWKDIGTSVAKVYVNTFEQNLIYRRGIFPLGQTYGGVSASELVAFRSLASAYGAKGTSFWDWQETKSTGWTGLGDALDTSLHMPEPEMTAPLLKKGAKGDQVLWMQEHLAAHIPSQSTSGVFDAQTQANLELFQTEEGLPATGETDALTWSRLLSLEPVSVNWTGGSSKAAAADLRISGGRRVQGAPASASLPPVRDEIAGSSGSH